MIVSNLIYFALIPIAVFLIFFITVETIEKTLHKFIINKIKKYIITGVVCFILVILIVILSFFVKF